MRTRTRTWLASAAAAIVAAAFTGTAQAGPPIVNDHFDFTSTHIEQEEHEGFCPDIPFLVLFEGHAKGSTLAVHHGDGFVYFGTRVRVSDTYTNVETGRSMSIEVVLSSKDQTIVDNGDGTITITGQDTGRQRSFDDDGNLLFTDTGLIRYEVLIDTAGTPGDPEDDEFLAFLGETKVAGPHETLDRDFCADLLEFIG